MRPWYWACAVRQAQLERYRAKRLARHLGQGPTESFRVYTEAPGFHPGLREVYPPRSSWTVRCDGGRRAVRAPQP